MHVIEHDEEEARLALAGAAERPKTGANGRTRRPPNGRLRHPDGDV
jgi:hypothetical protein